MRFIHQRLFDNGDETVGILYSGKNYLCTTLEDERRFRKVQGETRIDPGTYKLVWQENVTPLTVEYRRLYSFFDKHIMLEGVPRHSNIYIHVGNFDTDTDGCILVADGFLPTANDGNKTRYQLAANSRATFEKVYRHIGGYINSGMECLLEVRDEHWINRL